MRVAKKCGPEWVVGAASITNYTASGMLSRGVKPPESISEGARGLILAYLEFSPVQRARRCHPTWLLERRSRQ
jgi:hypothetical protein